MNSHDQIYGKGLESCGKKKFFGLGEQFHTLATGSKTPSGILDCAENPNLSLQTSEGFSEIKTVILCKSLYPLYSHRDPAGVITARATWS